MTETSLPDTDELHVEPGRPIRLVPMPPGLWMVILGVFAAVFSPFFGFLIGSSMGRPEGDPLLTPLYWGLFVGVVIGGIGVLSAVLGGRRLWQHLHREPRDEVTP